jgi:hypothetical protein
MMPKLRKWASFVDVGNNRRLLLGEEQVGLMFRLSNWQ